MTLGIVLLEHASNMADEASQGNPGWRRGLILPLVVAVLCLVLTTISVVGTNQLIAVEQPPPSKPASLQQLVSTPMPHSPAAHRSVRVELPCRIIGEDLGIPRCAPSFAVIGAMKCGTNAIRNYLRRNPQVHMASHESHGVTYKYNATINDVGRDPKFLAGLPPLPTNWNATKRFIVGDRAPSYMTFAEISAPRFKAAFPDAKIIAMLCDPVSRIFSEYHHQRKGQLTGRKRETNAHLVDFTEWLGLKPYSTTLERQFGAGQTACGPSEEKQLYSCSNVECQATLQKSRYDSHVAVWIREFGADNVFLLATTQLQNEPDVIVPKLWSFLGADPLPPNKAQQALQVREVHSNANKKGLSMPTEDCIKLRHMLAPSWQCFLDRFVPGDWYGRDYWDAACD